MEVAELARTFQENFGVNLVGVRIVNIVEDTMSSKFLAAYFRAIYIRYTIVGKILTKHLGVLSHFLMLKMHPSAMKSLFWTHLVDLGLYIFLRTAFFSSFRPLTCFVENYQKPARFMHKHSTNKRGSPVMSFMFGI